MAESLAEPERVDGGWCWRRSEVVPWTTDLHDITVGDQTYETYRDRSHQYVVALFAERLDREQEQLEMSDASGTQVRLGFSD
ncbi:hypothetical protein [Halorubrum sp. FL23]|uniref:hypothetical protein n=1 Tax=Halorubrum sp. FL23 TaxID=3458704 RepID=UPI00403447D5